MSFALRSFVKANNSIISGKHHIQPCIFAFVSRYFCDDRSRNDQDFTSSTIIVENKLNVQELPVIIRHLKDLSDLDSKPELERNTKSQDSLSYNLIQEEFKQCHRLQDVFSLLSKCTKITPNIALGAMERIYDLEKDNYIISDDSGLANNNSAKRAILEKLLKVVIISEDTQTILNALNIVSILLEPHKHKFCNELLLRVIDNKLTIQEICQFARFLVKNRDDEQYADIIDKLWVGFMAKDFEINEVNIIDLFSILPGLKVSKKIVLNLLEQKLSEVWRKIDVLGMQEILNVFVKDKCSTMSLLSVVSQWLYTNIHALDEEALLDVITKLTSLNYCDRLTEKSIEKYVTLKSNKIESPILMVGILNHCTHFKICNEKILKECSKYFINNYNIIPISFLNSFIFPFGYLYIHPHSQSFWSIAEEMVIQNFHKISIEDVLSILLSFIYLQEYPSKIASKVFTPVNIARLSPTASKQLHLVDTVLSLEHKDHLGPLLPKDQWTKQILQDSRINNIVNKTKDCFEAVAGSVDKVSYNVLIPNLCADVTYLIDVMFHPVGLGGDTFNWKIRAGKNENIAVLIHLSDHYCHESHQLVGPQMMRKRQLKILGMRVVSVQYSVLSRLYTTHRKDELQRYLTECINKADP